MVGVGVGVGVGGLAPTPNEARGNILLTILNSDHVK